MHSSAEVRSAMGFFKREWQEQTLSIPETELHDRGAVIIAERTPDCEYPVIEREILPEKTICPYCKGITVEGLEFCSRCGRKLL